MVPAGLIDFRTLESRIPSATASAPAVASKAVGLVSLRDPASGSEAGADLAGRTSAVSPTESVVDSVLKLT